MNKIKKCKVCGRECKNLNLGMCTKHYNQYKKYGYCLDTNPRTKKTQMKLSYIMIMQKLFYMMNIVKKSVEL